jgi:hypothetical protein
MTDYLNKDSSDDASDVYSATITIQSGKGELSYSTVVIEYDPPVDDNTEFDDLPSAYRHVLNIYKTYFENFDIEDLEEDRTKLN